NGLILWFGKTMPPLTRDYLAVGLNDGHLNLDIDLGSGSSKLVFNETRLDDGQWHEVDIVRYGRRVFLRVDNSIAVRGVIGGAKSQLDVATGLYLGMMVPLARLTWLSHPLFGLRLLGGLEDTPIITGNLYDKGFIGCVSN